MMSSEIGYAAVKSAMKLKSAQLAAEASSHMDRVGLCLMRDGARSNSSRICCTAKDMLSGVIFPRVVHPLLVAERKTCPG